jgi:hypothetical protein
MDFKKEMIENLKKSDVSFLTEKEKKEYINEVEEYEKSLNSITMDCLSECKTPREVVTYWHPSLQPKPCFAYDQ